MALNLYQGLQDCKLSSIYVGRERDLHVLGGHERVRARAGKLDSPRLPGYSGHYAEYRSSSGRFSDRIKSFRCLLCRYMCDDHSANLSQNLSSTAVPPSSCATSPSCYIYKRMNGGDHSVRE